MRIVIIILLLSLTSCVSYNKCVKRFPPEKEIIIKDSIVIKTETLWRDTVIYEQLEGDTVIVEKEGKIVEGFLNIDTLRKENKYAEALAWVQRNCLGLELRQKPVRLEFSLDSAVRISKHYKELYHSELKKEVREVRYIPGFYKFCLYFFLVVGGGLVVVSLLKFAFKVF